MKWLTIESAPRTNRAILVWTPLNKCQAMVCWIPAADDAGGYWAHFARGFPTLDQKPTHWMPLPEPPTADLERTP
jgi:hypothetical protein